MCIRDSVKGVWVTPQMISNIKNGRASVKPTGEEDIFIPCQALIVAIGQDIEYQHFEEAGVPVQRGKINVEKFGGFEEMPGVFAGGDCATGPSTVISAIAAGKVIAANIDEYLGLETLKVVVRQPLVATDTIDRIHTTATSHSRVFIIEVMGHKVGHVTLQSGIAGGADVILLPEIPYDIDKVAEVVENRFAAGKKFSIIAVAEGAISKEDAKLKKKQYKAKLAERRYPSVAYEIAAALEEKTKREIRVTVPGHTQRGGAPCAYDRVLATRVGAYAAELILNKEYGYMVGIVDGDTKKVPLSEVAGKLKYVDPKCQMIKDAKTIGISFGE